MPCPSQTKCRLLPSLARSVGFGPLNSPQKPRAQNNCRQQHATSRSGHHAQASSAMRNGSSPRFRPSASRATAASRSSRNHTLDVSAACARGCHFGARKLYPPSKLDLPSVVGRLVAWEAALGEAVRSKPTTYQERVRRPYEVKSPSASELLDMLRYQQGEVLLQPLNKTDQHYGSVGCHPAR